MRTRQFQDRDYSIFVADVNLAIDDQGIAKLPSARVVTPVVLASLFVEAVNVAFPIGHNDQPIMNHSAGSSLVHDIRFLVASACEVPDQSRAGVWFALSFPVV